jgi:creatinine amidohydrolase
MVLGRKMIIAKLKRCALYTGSVRHITKATAMDAVMTTTCRDRSGRERQPKVILTVPSPKRLRVGSAGMSRAVWSTLLFLLCTIGPARPASAQVYTLANMNTRQIQALDRQRTVILIPGGILEEHGPYLPSYTDGYAIEAYTRALSTAIVARPGWAVVVFPQIPLGNDPAKTIGAKRVFPGSYPVRMATLRAIYMDLASELGDQGFRWIFLVHNHGAPNHHKALNQASDYFHDTYGGTMVHLFGLKPVFLCCGTMDTGLSKDARAEDGFTVHAGVEEHSQLFFLRPDLIAPDVDKAPSVTARNFEDHVRIAKTEGWPGYFGAPRFATAAVGAQGFLRSSEKLIEVAMEILDGLDSRAIPRYADEMDPLNVVGEQSQLDYEKSVEKRQLDWLKSRKLQ